MTADQIIAWLRAEGSPAGLAGMSRYGIPSQNAFGVPMGIMKRKAKEIGVDHAAALALWQHGQYEARTMAVFLADAAQLSSDQADAWCDDFDNWAICDTACFSLFDRLPFAWDKVHQWGGDEREFVRRAGFALIWALSVHDKTAANTAFTDTFSSFRRAATDKRTLVKKSVDMALRSVGKRNLTLNASAIGLAQELSKMDDKTARWIGTHTLREITSDKVQARLKPR